ncbi:MAG TPA: NADH:flavin oxidoreductase [Thermodesulfobacteriota bacterium]|nr:NADH:flavin oxidoreductase [Thermodesulfobacteriota bacterium]
MNILGSPVKIGEKTAPNRIVNQPMECNDADEVGNPTDLTFGRYRRLAQGGAGIIFVEALTITRESRARKNQLSIGERTAPNLERLVKEMREISPESLILFQITHSGRLSGKGFSRLVTVYPLAEQEGHMLSEEEIDKIGDEFGRAALIARQAGADGIDFKQCHGYLCSEMLRPENTRRDRFGGSFENRTRFFSETMQKIKRTVGDGPFLLGARFSVYEGIPGGFGTPGPGEVIEDLTEPLAFARLMEKLRLDYINVSAGIPAITPEIVRPTRNYPEGVYRHFGWARAIKKTVNIPVIGSGYTYLREGKNELKEPDMEKRSFSYWAEKNLTQRVCDMVGIGRQSLADPLFVRKTLEGKTSEINYCTACGGCSLLLRNQAQSGCVIYFDLYKRLFKELRQKK